MTVKRVPPQEAAQLIEQDGYVYLDVRSIPEFDSGHPPGSYNVPLLHATPAGMRPNGEFMAVVAAVFPKDSKLVVGCRSGNRSLRAAEALLFAGYVDVVDQRGGIGGARDAFGQVQEAGWQDAGLAMTIEPEPDRAYDALLDQKNG